MNSFMSLSLLIDKTAWRRLRELGSPLGPLTGLIIRPLLRSSFSLKAASQEVSSLFLDRARGRMFLSYRTFAFGATDQNRSPVQGPARPLRLQDAC